MVEGPDECATAESLLSDAAPPPLRGPPPRSATLRGGGIAPASGTKAVDSLSPLVDCWSPSACCSRYTITLDWKLASVGLRQGVLSGRIRYVFTASRRPACSPPRADRIAGDAQGGRQSPFASLVTVATAPGGEPILLLSRLAVHTQNLDRDRRASLLLVEPGGEGGDPLAGARLTLVGKVGDRDHDPSSAAGSWPATRKRRSTPISPISASANSPRARRISSPASAGSSISRPGPAHHGCQRMRRCAGRRSERHRAHERGPSPTPSASTPPACSASPMATGA